MAWLVVWESFPERGHASEDLVAGDQESASPRTRGSRKLMRDWNSFLRKGRTTEGLSRRAAGLIELQGTCCEQKDKCLGRVFSIFRIWSELGCFCKTITYVYFF